MNIIKTNNYPTINFFNLIRKDNSYSNIFLYENSLYYFKRFNLNEFIGEVIAERLNIRTVNYDLFEYKSSFGSEIVVASKNFVNPTSSYSFAVADYSATINNFLEYYKDKCIDEDNFFRFSEHIIKMFVIDIYMGQHDRHEGNCQIEKYDTGYIDLAPLYDYSNSCFDENIVYENPFYTFSNENSYIEFFEKFPNCIKLLNKVKNYNLIDIIKYIEETKGFKLSDIIIEEYKRKEEITQKKLQKIIK